MMNRFAVRSFSTALKNVVHDVIIIGSGPAGYTSALYTARANLKPLLFEGLEVGGQLSLTSTVENFPGFPDGIQGPALMDAMKTQASKFGAVILPQMVKTLDLQKRPFTVVDGEGKTHQSKSVVVACGASARMLGLESERKLLGQGVSTCAVCDGAFFKDMRVIVVGGGDAALEEAIFLTRFAREVHVVHRREQFRASKIMQDRARATPKLHFILNSELVEVADVAQRSVTGVKLRNVITNVVTDFAIDGVFVCIGHTPNSELVRGQLQLDAQGYIQTLPGTTRTNIEGVFACGDIQDKKYRQAITAAGSGCMAAIEVEHYITQLNSSTSTKAHL